jgi:hypothetical protein
MHQYIIYMMYFRICCRHTNVFNVGIFGFWCKYARLILLGFMYISWKCRMPSRYRRKKTTTNPLRLPCLSFQMFWNLNCVNAHKILFASVKCRYWYPWCIRYYIASFDAGPKYLEEYRLHTGLYENGFRGVTSRVFCVAKTHTVAHSCYQLHMRI